MCSGADSTLQCWGQGPPAHTELRSPHKGSLLLGILLEKLHCQRISFTSRDDFPPNKIQYLDGKPTGLGRLLSCASHFSHRGSSSSEDTGDHTLFSPARAAVHARRHTTCLLWHLTNATGQLQRFDELGISTFRCNYLTYFLIDARTGKPSSMPNIMARGILLNNHETLLSYVHTQNST